MDACEAARHRQMSLGRQLRWVVALLVLALPLAAWPVWPRAAWYAVVLVDLNSGDLEMDRRLFGVHVWRSIAETPFSRAVRAYAGPRPSPRWMAAYSVGAPSPDYAGGGVPRACQEVVDVLDHGRASDAERRAAFTRAADLLASCKFSELGEEASDLHESLSTR